MDMDQALQTFIVECQELLQGMEDALLQLENTGPDSETVNAMFRAAHTIKGSAGLFGLDSIVSFTHVVENVLDKVRGAEITIDSDLVALLLLPCGDHIGRLVEQVAARGGVPKAGNPLRDESRVELTQPDAETRAAGEALLKQLKAHLGSSQGNLSQVAIHAQQEAQVHASGGGAVATDTWHITLEFGKDVLRNGMDPLSFIRYLQTLGEIIELQVAMDALPEAAEMDPESCYLGFEIDLKSGATKEAIESVFEFVRDDCQVRILSPIHMSGEYIQQLLARPDEIVPLGEMLIRCGVLTRRELDECLEIQAKAAEKGATAPFIGEVLASQGVVKKQVVEAAVEKQIQVKDAKVQESRFIRVHADKLDHLINLVGELVIAGAATSLLAQRSRDAALHETTSTVSRLVEEIRDGALQMRMVQIGETFNRFHRVVRDVSKEIGKEIKLLISGAETELDKSVVEKIGDPLMHLVRNSMDHGIETAEVRLARGKTARGAVQLNAYHDSGSIVIEVGDDGGGLNRERILNKALERGLVSPNQNLSDQEIYSLIFEAGFSTAEQVTSLSGRGVGMDVVRRNIEALRGTVEIDSQQGVGTVIRIRLPLTLAIIDGFLMGVNGASYVVPLDMVVECIELSELEQRATRERNYINLRGEVLPFLRLKEVFEVPGKVGRRENIVVVQYAGQKAGLVVDELMGEFQTVIKPLGKLFSNLKGISGSTILGSGEVALILDVPALIQRAVNKETQLLACGSAKQLVQV